MARPEKVQAVADIKERVDGAEAVFITEYAGLKVQDQQTLRRNLRAADAEYKVFKMTLTRRAVDELGHDGIMPMLTGPTGLAFAASDPVPAAKALRDFNRDHAALVIKGMLLGGRVLPPEQVSALADIEPREVLLARLAGAFQAPLAGFVGVLSAVLRKTGYAFQALLDERIAAGESLPETIEEPAAEAPAAPEDVAVAEVPAATEAADEGVPPTEEAPTEEVPPAEEGATEAAQDEGAPTGEVAATDEEVAEDEGAPTEMAQAEEAPVADAQATEVAPPAEEAATRTDTDTAAEAAAEAPAAAEDVVSDDAADEIDDEDETAAEAEEA